MGAALNGVNGTGNLVRAVVPQPAGVAQTHSLVAGLGGGQTDLVVGGGVPELPENAPCMSLPPNKLALRAL